MPDPLSTLRIIGHYQGPEPGPMVIAIAGLHGNEPAGIQALERLFELLAEEPFINPGFSFKGELLAIRGNLPALATGQRYLDHDMNRIWQEDRIHRLRKQLETPFQESTISSEEKELLAVLDVIEIAIAETNPSHLVMLDLHTTTADGGIFTITGDDLPSMRLGAELYAPVIKGMLSGLTGTTLHYFREPRFGENRRLTALTFEAGQHDDPASVDRALAAAINLLRGVGCVQEADVRTLHDELLKQNAAELPRLTELAYVHRITDADQFKMEPGYCNFQEVAKGELLGSDRNGKIYAPAAGYILMPLYQAQGEEGFFIVQNFTIDIAY